MLILLAAHQNGTNPDAILLIVLAMATLASAFAAIITGALQPRLVDGPERIPMDRPVWPLVFVLCSSIFFYFGCTSAFIEYRRPQAASANAPPSDGKAMQLSEADQALLSVAPGIVVWLIILMGDAAVRGIVGQNLGFCPLRFPRGLLLGLLGALIVLPPLYWLSYLLDGLYKLIQYHHPTEHPLLHTLGESSDHRVRLLIVLGACLVAPLFEETVFRGHIQTLLRRMFVSMTRPAPVSEGFAAMPLPSDDAAAITSTDAPIGLPPPSLPPPSRPPVMQAWGAILVTSLLFASLHPAWSRPIIFALSICLGYAYERTRNLWVPIIIHCIFNSISTWIFLASSHGQG